jgi:CIC family chloride channel protein
MDSERRRTGQFRRAMRRAPAWLERMRGYFAVHESRAFGRFLLLYVGLGVLVGGIAIGFHVAVEAAERLLLGEVAGFRPAAPGGEEPLLAAAATEFRRWALLLVPALGALVAAILVERLAPEAAGGGINAMIRAYHEGAAPRRRVIWVKTVASALVLGSGGSAGREGPVAQIGMSVGSVVARALQLTRREALTLAAAGAAAGIGALFHAPVASALVIAEILYREMELEHEVIVPSLIASIVAYSIYTIKFAWSPLFLLQGYRFESPLELGPYLVLALVLAIQARWFIAFYHAVDSWFTNLALPRWLKPALGGLGVGVIGFALPATIGTGYGILQGALDGNIAIATLLGLALLKSVTTALTVGSGGSGGVFAPAMVIGGALGGVVGHASHELLPALTPQPGAFVVLGMAGFFAAVSNTPLSTIILVSEMTGNYQMLVPAMWVCIVAYLLGRDTTIFEAQAGSRMDTRGHLNDALDQASRRFTVGDAMNNVEHEAPIAVHPDTPLGELRTLFAESHHAVFPVVDDDGRLVGVVDEPALREAVASPDLDDLVVAADLIGDTPTLLPDEPLRDAMEKLVTGHHDELVVVDPDDAAVVIGTLSRRDVVAFFEEGIQGQQEPAPARVGVLDVLGSLVVDARDALRPENAQPAETQQPADEAADSHPANISTD